MKRQYQMQIDIMNMILRFIAAFTIIALILLLFTGKVAYVWREFLLIPAAVASFLIWKSTKHIWSYSLLHLVLVGIYYLIAANLLQKILYCSYILIYALIQILLGASKQLRNTSKLFMLVILGTYFTCQYFYAKETGLLRLFFFLSLTYILIYMVNMYYMNFELYFKGHESRVNVPMTQIKSSNGFFVSVFFGVCFLAMVALKSFPLARFVMNFLRLLRDILRAIIVRYSESGKAEPLVDSPKTQTQPLFPLGLEDMESDEPSKVWIFMEKMLTVTVIVLVIALVVGLIVYAAYKIFQLYYQGKNNKKEVQIEFISPFVKEDSGKQEGRGLSFGRKLLKMIHHSNNDRIRKQYQKAVLNHSKPEQELQYLTPLHLSKYALNKADRKAEEKAEQEKEEEITNLYEKARYSNQECSKEEVQSVKELLKK
jgi:hypothetical protein